MANVTGFNAAKSVVCTLIGAAPGAIWLINVGTTQSLVIACLGAFIGFGLSLPGVSATRVLGATVGMILARNVPMSPLQDKILDTFMGEQESRETEQAADMDAEVVWPQEKSYAKPKPSRTAGTPK